MIKEAAYFKYVAFMYHFGVDKTHNQGYNKITKKLRGGQLWMD